MVAAFDPTKTLSPDFFTQAKNTYPNGVLKVEEEVPASTLLALILIAGAIMIVATYALFVSGLSFLGRLIELWVLIIAAPFAFMSSTVPKLSGIERWGWEAWLKRVLAAAFMAPAFMFLLYLIFLLISADIFNTIVKPSTGTNDAAGMMKMILGVVLPTLVICTLLLKATKLAREGSGKYTDDVMKYGKMAGGLALGAAAGGAAVLGRAGIGRAGAAMANSEWAKKREAEGKFGSGVFRDVTKKIGSGRFDIRGARIGGQTLASATGVKLGEGQKGGFSERRKMQVEKRQKRAQDLEVGEDEYLKQELNSTEMNLQVLLSKNAQEIETIDKLIEKKRQEASDANSKLNAAKGTSKEGEAQEALQKANASLDNVKNRKTDLLHGNQHQDRETGKIYHYEESAQATSGKYKGKNIDELEKLKKEQAQTIKTENVERKINYSATIQTKWSRTKGNILGGFGTYTKAASKEAAHKIITEVKLDSGTKT